MIKTQPYNLENVMRLKFSVVLASLILFLVISVSYHFSIAKHFTYMGFLLNPDATRFVVVAVICLFSIFAILVFAKDRYLVLFSFLFMVFFVLPSGVIYINDSKGMSPFFASLAAYFFLLLAFPLVKTVRIAEISPQSCDFFILILFFICFFIVFYTHKFNIDFSALLLSDVYSARVASRERNWAGSVYAYFWLAKFICPMLILRGIEEKKYLYTFLGLLAMLYMFMVTGHKSVFFGAVITVGMYFLSSKYKKEMPVLIWSLVAVFTVACLASFALNNISLESMFIRRLLFIPSLLNVYYFEFFESDYLYYSTSYLAPFLSYSYDLTPPHLIGQFYFGSSEMSANNGIISDGYMNLGYIGVFINILLVAYFLKLFRNSQVPARYFGIMVLFFYSIQGSSFSTVLITHGGWLIFLYFSLVKYKARFSPAFSN